MKNEIIISSAFRTAIGSLGKSLKNISAYKLGSEVISELTTNNKIKKSDVDEIIMGQVLTGGMGQNPARRAAIEAGIPIEKPAHIVNQVWQLQPQQRYLCHLKLDHHYYLAVMLHQFEYLNNYYLNLIQNLQRL